MLSIGLITVTKLRKMSVTKDVFWKINAIRSKIKAKRGRTRKNEEVQIYVNKSKEKGGATRLSVSGRVPWYGACNGQGND